MARSRRSWAQLLLLLLAGPAACAASPADDGAGPGGRGPRGRARGDSSADEAVPRHDSSYGTFAGEFYDLRYLSEEGLPWWSSGSESTCQCRGHRFYPWSEKIPHAKGQRSPHTTTTEPACCNC